MNSDRTQPMEPAGFREALIDAVDYGLMVLGEIVRRTIYERIENDYRLKRADFPEQLEAFHKALQGILGMGAKTVERLIAKNLYQRLGLNFVVHSDWTVVEYINHARAALDLNRIHASSGN